MHERERIDGEIAAATQRIAESAEVTKADIDARLAQVTDRIITETDDVMRHRLAVERAALMQYKKQMLGEEGIVLTDKTVDDAPDMRWVSRAVDEKYPPFDRQVRGRAEATYRDVPVNNETAISDADSQVRLGGEKAA